MFGSDHYIHLSIIKNFRNNKFKNGIKDIFTLDEKYSYYPILYHWILAKYFYKAAITNPNSISKAIDLLKLISFNLFLNYIGDYKLYDLILLNLSYLFFPFNFSPWNAKNKGLSARNFGILLVNIYLYLSVIYLNEKNLIYFLLIIISSFLVLKSSMMGFQFICLTTPVFSIISNNLILIVIPFITIFLNFLFYYKSAKNHLIGLYNYYYNYKNYLSKIFIFKERINIYGDFLNGFYFKFKISGLTKPFFAYVYKNPIVEMLIGFPLLIIIINKIIYGNTYLSLYIASSIFIFFVITLNPLRFLGEPQRYLEFVVPFISILAISSDKKLLFFVLILSLILILFLKILTLKKDLYHEDFLKLNQFLNKNFDENCIMISNDNNLLKKFKPIINIITEDTSKKFKDFHQFKSTFKSDFSTLSVSFLREKLKTFRVDLILLNTELYDYVEIKFLMEGIKTKEVFSNGKFVIYEKINQ